MREFTIQNNDAFSHQNPTENCASADQPTTKRSPGPKKIGRLFWGKISIGNHGFYMCAHSWKMCHCTTILYDTSMIWRSENGHARNYDHFKREMKSMDGSWGGCSNLSQKSMAFIWVIHHDPSHIALWSFLDLSLSIDIPFGMNRFVPQLGSLGLRQMRYCRSAG